MADIMPVLLQNDTLQKFCLTDSKGQHKNNRNEGRSNTKKLKATAVDVPDEEQNELDIYNIY